MSIEVACGNCQGRLLIETPGTVVACPHCGTHISIPNPSADADNSPAAPEPPAAPVEVPTPQAAVETTEPLAQPAAESQPAEPVANEPVPATESNAPTDWMPPTDDAAPAEFPDFSQMDFTADSPAEAGPTNEPAEVETEMHISPDIAVSSANDASDENGFPTKSDSNVATSAAVATEPAAETTQTEAVPESANTATESAPSTETTSATPQPTAAPAQPATSQNNQRMIPRTMFIAVVSYASTVTLFCLYLLFSGGGNGNRRELESLPDLKPPMKKKKIALRLIGEGEAMNPGHTLQLGESQRYGNVKVTPVKVTRSPIQFKYYSGDNSQTKDPSKPVLKLWLKFENVSEDQEFAPLDRLLVMKSVEDKKRDEFEKFRANNFVCRVADKGNIDELVLMYNNTPYVTGASDWDYVDQTIDRDLKPGERLETYIPTEEEGLDRLEGDLVWRIQFRKGYNPESLRGVTTLIEIRFHSDDIQAG